MKKHSLSVQLFQFQQSLYVIRLSTITSKSHNDNDKLRDTVDSLGKIFTLCKHKISPVKIFEVHITFLR